MAKLFVLFIFIPFIAMSLYAKDVRVRSSEKLRNMLSKSPYALVLFYNKSREKMKDKAERQKINDMESMFRSLSKDDYYRDAKLQFIRAETNREGLQSAPRRYELAQVPAFAIFLGRELRAKMYGYPFRDQVENFIDYHLKDKMVENIKQADELRKKRLQEAKIRSYSYPPYWWNSPYWFTGYYPYYGGPYFGYYW